MCVCVYIYIYIYIYTPFLLYSPIYDRVLPTISYYSLQTCCFITINTDIVFIYIHVVLLQTCLQYKHNLKPLCFITDTYTHWNYFWFTGQASPSGQGPSCFVTNHSDIDFAILLEEEQSRMYAPYIHIYIYIHTYIHTYVYIYICIYIYIYYSDV